MSIRTLGRVIGLAGLIVVVSCTIDPPISPPPDACPLPSNVITGRDILAAGGASAFEGIRLLRIPPHRTAVVYLDGHRRGDPGFLRTVRHDELREMYYLPPSAPASCPGSGHAGGVIVVRTRLGR